MSEIDIISLHRMPEDRTSGQIKIPDWYKEAWKPDSDSLKYWKYQACIRQFKFDPPRTANRSYQL